MAIMRVRRKAGLRVRSVMCRARSNAEPPKSRSSTTVGGAWVTTARADETRSSEESPEPALERGGLRGGR